MTDGGPASNNQSQSANESMALTTCLAAVCRLALTGLNLTDYVQSTEEGTSLLASCISGGVSFG
jgi:hypothetical protein